MPERPTCLSLQLRASARVATEMQPTPSSVREKHRLSLSLSLTHSLSLCARDEKFQRERFFFSVSTVSKARSLLGLNNSTEWETKREREREIWLLSVGLPNRLEEMEGTGLLRFLVEPRSFLRTPSHTRGFNERFLKLLGERRWKCQNYTSLCPIATLITTNYHFERFISSTYEIPRMLPISSMSDDTDGTIYLIRFVSRKIHLQVRYFLETRNIFRWFLASCHAPRDTSVEVTTDDLSLLYLITSW